MSALPSAPPQEPAWIVYGMHCVWWDSIDKTGHVTTSMPGHKLPVCPHCGSVLFQIEPEKWFAGLDRYEADGHPGYRAMWEWSRGKCFPNQDAQRAAFQAAQHQPPATGYDEKV